MDRYYSLEQIKSAIKVTHEKYGGMSEEFDIYKLMQMPTADVQPVKRGKWMEKHHAYSDEENPIEEWQSCKCSECGRYDTRPYLYYFSEPRFCSWCGADMGGEDDA